MEKKLSKKQLQKRCDKKCHFCDVSEYELLDVHRLIPGADGGKYKKGNMVVACALCHRKIHAGMIKILGRYFSSKGIYVINYIDEHGVEFMK